jgi:hypothetical protein
MFKNAGLFFGGGLPQGGYMSTGSGTSVEVAMDFDMLWVCGPNQYPGGCDPTYSFWWAVSTIRGMNPELDQNNAAPTLEGYPYLPYTGVLDWSLVEGDTSGIKNH